MSDGQPYRERRIGKHPLRPESLLDEGPESRERMGITPGMVRISVGIDHPEDLIADLKQALEAV